MRLSVALEEKKFDLRLRDKLVHEGKLSARDVEKYMKSLGDDEGQAITAGQDPESGDTREQTEAQ